MEQELCTKMPINLINAGEFINAAAAKESLLAYSMEPNVQPLNDPNHIFGHTFGIQKLREFLLKMDLYNAGEIDDEDKIYGVRIYYGKSKRSDPDFPLPDEALRDVFIMPVKKNGEDLYRVVPLLAENMILSGSRPCPNQCSTPLQFIQE
jgi:hypothetical protein